MWRWIRLVWLLAALGGAGVLAVHYQTAVVTTGNRVRGMREDRDALRERNRMLRIEIGRASVPDQVRESWKALSGGEGEETAPAGGEGRPSGDASSNG